MSYFVGGAIIVSAVAGAASSKNASDKAAKGQKKGMEQSLEITNRARQDVMQLFDRSAKSARIGMDQAMNFYKQAATQRMTPFLQGNQAAQNVIGIGAQQAQNAILGLPVDMAAMNQQPQVQPTGDYMLGAQLPAQDLSPIFGPPEVAEEQVQSAKKDNGLLTGGGMFRSPLDKKMLDPQERLENPLGLSKGLSDKLNPRKLIKKLF